MADAGVVRDGDRLPWLEPYRAPAMSKPRGPRVALVAAALISVAAALSIPALRTADVPADQPASPPQVSMPLAAPDAMQLDVPEVPVTASADAVVEPSAPVSSAKRRVARRHAYRPARRIVSAGPERDSYDSVIAEQIANLPPPAPVIQPAPPPIILRPAVNPKAEVVKGKTAQLGVYLSHRQAEAAWRSAIKDYTFLVTMPRDIQPVRFRSSARRFYRLQLGTPSRRHALQLCRNLRQTGRACTVA